MIKFKLLLVVLSFIIIQPILAQKYFTKHYGLAYPTNEFGLGLCQLPDSSFFLLTSQRDSNNHATTRNINRFIDKSGNSLSNVIYPPIGRPKYFDKTKLIGNKFFGYGTRGTYVKSIAQIDEYNLLGQILKSNYVGDTNVYWSQLYDLIKLNDNTYITCGKRIDIGANKYGASYYRLDSTLNTIWEKVDSSNGCCISTFKGLLELSTDTIMMIGDYYNSGSWNSSLNTSSRMWFRKIDKYGNTLLDYKYFDPDSNFSELLLVNSVIKSNDGKIIVNAVSSLGTNEWIATVMKFEIIHAFGLDFIQRVWRKEYRIPSYNAFSWFTKIIPLGQGNGYVLFGEMSDTTEYFDAAMVKITDDGDEVWRKTYKYPSPESAYVNEYMYDGVKTLDNGYAMIGQTGSLAVNSDVYFVKTNCNGDTASPKALANIIVDTNNPNQMQVYNLSQFYDTCTFSFSDGSADVVLTMYDTVQTFTHAFMPGTTVSVKAQACNQEYDTLRYTQIITPTTMLPKNTTGMLGTISPNPTNNDIWVDYYLPPNQTNASLQIINTEGVIINKQQIVNQTGKAHLQLSNYASGIYLVQLVTNNGVSCSKKVVRN
jgi:hypothetical protein